MLSRMFYCHVLVKRNGAVQAIVIDVAQNLDNNVPRMLLCCGTQLTGKPLRAS